ncbi:UNVERIFIED_CONTAM: prolyl oligopeptidase family protein [Williamsia faeni]
MTSRVDASSDSTLGRRDRSQHSYGASVSPDGRAFAYIVDDGTGYPRAAQRTLHRDGAGPMRAVELPCPGPVRTLIHSPDGHWLACEVAPGGGEHHQVWIVTTDPDDPAAIRVGAPEDLTAGEHTTGYATVQLIGWDANRVLLNGIEPDGTAHALMVDPLTRAVTDLDARIGGHLIDSWKGAALLRVGPRGYREMLLLRRESVIPLLPNDPGASTDQGVILDQGFEHASLLFPGLGLVGQDRDLDSVQALVRSDFDAVYPRLLAIDVGRYGIRFTVLAQRSGYGLDEFAISNDQSTVAILWNNKGHSELQVMTLPERTLHPPIELPGTVVGELSISASGSLIAMTVQAPDMAPTVGLINWREGHWTPIDHGRTTPTDGPGPELVEFSARDGMPLSGWLYRPESRHADPRTSGQEVPGHRGGAGRALIYFHGGPEAQARPEYSFLFPALLEAGITVFAANVRGSSGFGRLFSHADDRYGRYAGINDAADCARFLIREGYAAPDQIACAGRSYGGYLTLACLTFHAELFAAGVSICGMSDLESFFSNTEPWIAVAAYTKYGHPEADNELLRDLSPIHRISELRAPLLVIHGRHDTNVPVSESEQIVEKARALGARAELILFPNEGHDIVIRDNQRALTAALRGWIVDAFNAAAAAR